MKKAAVFLMILTISVSSAACGNKERMVITTGDLGTMDKDGNVFIKGRSKNMLLGANGQNIYPEEIEDKLNP